MSTAPATLRFFAGTVVVTGLDEGCAIPHCRYDAKDACFRAPAAAYAAVTLWLRDQKIPVVDEARRYEVLTLSPTLEGSARPFQDEALAAWRGARGRGVVVLPTGAGKTRVGLMAIAAQQRSTLVVAPTLELVRQWQELLEGCFAVNVGVVGGGVHEVLPLTVTTYDSAWAHVEHLGNRFGLVIFDEVHHLCAESYAFAARLSIAPYRLGLTATPERSDGREALLQELVGPVVFRAEIDQMEGRFLSEYDTVTIPVVLSDDERKAFDEARARYRAFVVSQGIRMSSPAGFGQFIMRAAGSAEGQDALRAYRAQRAIAFQTPRKLDVVQELLERHRGVRTLLFTDDNATAYGISRRFLVPVITHQTKLPERKAILEGFKDGSLPVLASSRVLNEGVDVPDAEVAIVVSGSGSVREHVQRLGRVLRMRDGKRATLYELVTEGTHEGFTSERRRDHVAYR